MGLADSKTALRLSQQVTGGFERGKLNSVRRDEIHLISAMRRAKLPYSAYVLEHETMDYFLDCHKMRLGPRKTQNREPVWIEGSLDYFFHTLPDVDRQSSGSEAQSAS